MRIVHIVGADSAGAAKAAYRLHQSQIASGVESIFLSKKRVGGWPGCRYANKSFWDPAREQCLAIAHKITRKLLVPRDKRDIQLQMVPSGFLKQALEFKPDIVHFHWVDDGVGSLREIAALGDAMQDRMVWTFHDYRAFSAGYFYLLGRLDAWMADGANPARVHNFEDAPVGRRILTEKVKLFGQRKWGCISPCQFMLEAAKASPVFASSLHALIPYGLETEAFQPLARNKARDILNLPSTLKIICFGAANPDEPRKGWKQMSDALRSLATMMNTDREELPLLLTFGGNCPAGLDSLGFPVRHLGTIQDEITMNLVLAAADLFVAPSTEDNLPNVVIETLASGTPGAAFHIGGMPDLLQHGQTGWLAKPFDTQSLADGFRYFISQSPEEAEETRAACRNSAESTFNLAAQQNAVTELYRQVMEKNQHA